MYRHIVKNTVCVACVAAFVSFGTQTSTASGVYWNLFNIEGENTQSAVYVTYSTRNDMLTDQNRTGNFIPAGFGAAMNVVGSGSDGNTYWNLFNIEGENTQSAVYVTYSALNDMLTDQNRTGNFIPAGFGAAMNVVGSGSDGNTYWNLFNIEGENTQSAVYVTYSALNDMLTDQNRTGNFIPAGFGAAMNVVGSGSDGNTYWNLFNIEGENTQSAVYVTYSALNDMLTDQNRTGNFIPAGFGAAMNVVGSGAWVPLDINPVPLPTALPLFATGLGALGLLGWRRKRKKAAAMVAA